LVNKTNYLTLCQAFIFSYVYEIPIILIGNEVQYNPRKMVLASHSILHTSFLLLFLLARTLCSFFLFFVVISKKKMKKNLSIFSSKINFTVIFVGRFFFYYVLCPSMRCLQKQNKLQTVYKVTEKIIEWMQFFFCKIANRYTQKKNMGSSRPKWNS
jgi:hypothetical protein